MPAETSVSEVDVDVFWSLLTHFPSQEEVGDGNKAR